MTTTTDLDRLLPGQVVTDPDVATGYASDAYPQVRGLGGTAFTLVRPDPCGRRHHAPACKIRII